MDHCVLNQVATLDEWSVPYWELTACSINSRSFGIRRDWLSFVMPLIFGTKRKCAKVNDPPIVWPIQILVMSFGLTNTPMIFMGLMSQVSHEYSDIWVAERTVDMLVYSTSRVKHGRHLVSVLEVLSKRDSLPSSWEVSFGWGSVILRLCNEQEWTRSQHDRTRTHSCTCA